MELIIIGMDMPENCTKCKIVDDCNNCEGYPNRCPFAPQSDKGWDWDNPPTDRPDYCPLREFPKDIAASDTYQTGYDSGMADAWSIAGRIVCEPENGGLTHQQMLGIFETQSAEAVFLEHTAATARDKIRKGEQFALGDEVENDVREGDGRIGVCIQLKQYPNGLHAGVMWSNGDLSYYPVEALKRTGRRIPQIAQILEDMQEG